MSKSDRIAFVSFIGVTLVGALIALAGSQGQPVMNGLPLFTWLVIVTFGIQWLAFIPAFILQTEKFYDLTGSLTYLTTIILALVSTDNLDVRGILLSTMIIIWAMRLGSFLFTRIHKAGKDGRFDTIKPSFIGFLNAWTLQGLWVTITNSAALLAIISLKEVPLHLVGYIGLLLWITGFIIEIIADQQKSAFNANLENKGKFINVGLWSRSQHPNYFGEIVLWMGIAVLAFPALSGWQLIGLLSPIFVFVLLVFISGIPLLQKRADAKWGGQPDYEAYKKKTPLLFPRLF